MAIDLLALPGCDDLALTCPKFVVAMKKIGVTYKGKDIDKTLGYSILAAQPYAMNPAACGAVRFLERVDPRAFDDPTKVMRCCQRIKTSSSNQNQEHIDMFVYAIESMAVSLLAGNANAGAFTTECLAGQARGSPGLMQTCVTKKKLVSWFLDDISSKINAASGAEVPLTAAGYHL